VRPCVGKDPSRGQVNSCRRFRLALENTEISCPDAQTVAVGEQEKESCFMQIQDQACSFGN